MGRTGQEMCWARCAWVGNLGWRWRIVGLAAVLGCSGSGSRMPDDAGSRVTLTVTVTGPGSVSRSPDGDVCGAGCVEYPAGTTVVLTPVPQAGFSVASWHGGGCDTSGDRPCHITLAADTTVGLDFCTYNRVVDPVAGDDAASGSCGAPFRTLTHALAVAPAFATISLRPGRYDAAHGESFPIDIPVGFEVVGDVAGKGAGAAPVVIEGGDPDFGVAVTLRAGAKLRGVTVRGTMVGIDASFSALIQDDTIENASSTGVQVALGGGSLKIIDNRITGNAFGISFSDPFDGNGSAGSIVQGNVIRGNATGVDCAGDCGDLGGGAGGSTGGNQLICNTLHNLRAATFTAAPLTFAARNNQWDAAPPTRSCATTPSDICESTPQSVSVVADGYSPTTQPCQ